MSAPLLSVVVPVHNVAPYLRRCMDSILHDNRCADVEIIAVDDASTDESPTILAIYASDPRVQVTGWGPTVAWRERGRQGSSAHVAGTSRSSTAMTG